MQGYLQGITGLTKKGRDGLLERLIPSDRTTTWHSLASTSHTRFRADTQGKNIPQLKFHWMNNNRTFQFKQVKQFLICHCGSRKNLKL